MTKTSFDALLSVILNLDIIWYGLVEMSREVRSMKATGLIFAAVPLPEEYGVLALDDQLRVIVDKSDAFRAVFLFDSALVVCSPPSAEDFHETVYPIREWEYGPSLQALWKYHFSDMSSDPKYSLRVVRVISKEELGEGDLMANLAAEDHVLVLSYPSHTRFYPPKRSNSGSSVHYDTLAFTFSCREQHVQWFHLLSGFVGRVDVHYPPTILDPEPQSPLSNIGSDIDHVVNLGDLHKPKRFNDDSDLHSVYSSSRSMRSFNSDLYSLRSIDPEPYPPPMPPLFSQHYLAPSHDSGVGGLDLTPRPAKPWSLVARRGPRSESSSFIMQQDLEDDDAGDANSDPPLSASPGALNGYSHPNENGHPVPPREDTWANANDLPDIQELTDQVRKDGMYPEAWGGFADVWKGVWTTQSGEEKAVAVKVLRARISSHALSAGSRSHLEVSHANGIENGDGNVETESPETKMARRLLRELRIHSTLDHPHILPLYGVVEGWGWGMGLVCPWEQHGSMSKYLEKAGDLVPVKARMAWVSHSLYCGSILNGSLFMFLIVDRNCGGSAIL